MSQQSEADIAFRSTKVQQAMLTFTPEQRMEVWRAFRKGNRQGWMAIEQFTKKPHDSDVGHGKEI